jgi:hypothetical protein
MVSRTKTLKLHDVDSPALSKAVQDTNVVVPASNFEPDSGEQLVFAIPDPSVAVALYVTVAYVRLLSGLTVVLLGHDTIGSVASVTTMLKLHDDEAPPTLMAVHVTEVVVASTNVLPVDGEHVLDVMASEPPAVALYVAVADGTPVVGDITLLVGHDIVGGVAVLTVIVKEQLDDLLAKSIAVHVTVVEPTGNSEPDAYEHDALVIPEPSVALNVQVATAPLLEVGCKFMDDGQVTVGLAASVTNTRPEHDLVRPALSVVVHVYGV